MVEKPAFVRHPLTTFDQWLLYLSMTSYATVYSTYYYLKPSVVKKRFD